MIANCINGIWENIIVDDYFPCIQGDNTPIFSSSKEGEIWTLLLEKAYAKIFGGYVVLEGGKAGDVLRNFTGAPVSIFHIKNQYSRFNKVEDVWSEVLRSFKNNYIMCAGTKSKKIVED